MITASKSGCNQALSYCVNRCSDVELIFNFSGIDIDDITALSYKLGRYTEKSIGSGVERVGDNYVVSLSESDTDKRGKFFHTLKVTDSTGTYKATLNYGRLDIQL